MAQTWTQIIKPPQDGELVNQEITGRALKSLQERTDYLYQHLTEFSAANGKLAIQNAPIDSSVELGDWVYFDSVSGKYKKAVAEGSYVPSLKSYRATDRAYVVGMCVAKSGGLASILMHGWIQSLSALGISGSNMVKSPETYSGGRYYLSAAAAGKMSTTGVAPIVQLGFFSGDTAFVGPLQKDIFESHTHYSTLLPSKPAASQNNALSGLHVYSGNVHHVDYFYSGASTPDPAPTGVVMSIKGNGSAASPSLGTTFRIEIYRTDADKMGVQIFGDGAPGNLLSIGNPASGAAITAENRTLDWPAYGEWVAIPNTGVSVSFVNLASPGVGGLPEDIKTAIAKNTARFKVFYPNDTIGWTNANPYDGAYAMGASFRYVREFDTNLNAMWPPMPAKGASIENNGFRLVYDTDFKCYPQDLFWIPNGYDGTNHKAYGPWSYDYPSTDPSYAKRLELFFTNYDANTTKSVVTSLSSASNWLSIKDCYSGEDAVAGNLVIDLDLNLGSVSGADASECVAAIDSSTQNLIKSSLVSRVTPGTGIRITSASGSPSTSGSVIISSDAFQSSGEVSIVSLKNAKESLVSGVTPAVMFLDPNSAKCQAVAKIKIPQGAPTGPSLQVSAAVFGTKSGDGQAVFKAVYYVVRPGTSLTSLIEVNAFATQVWKAQFSSYAANTVLSSLLPESGSIVSGTGLSGLTVSSGTINYGGSNHSGQSLQAGDTVLVVLERVTSYGGSVTDSYSSAEVGLTNITWQLV